MSRDKSIRKKRKKSRTELYKYQGTFGGESYTSNKLNLKINLFTIVMELTPDWIYVLLMCSNHAAPLQQFDL